ncbi:putative quinol monooxygenase [Kitasatospora purpeofusca]|uniref:putative quinol monooxygenase n=1 Tax=Kitasatospora purpeofusca TaxID=67352 RepID=UPI0007C50464|nr:antibiotic biosynthesis monooxygenase family protein [Kitasatospora purpeofusca]
MTVREGCGDEFRAAWLETAQATAALPGCVAQSLLRDPRNPRTHLVMADWSDLAALESFQNSPERERLSTRLEPFRESAHKHVLDLVEHVVAGTASTRGGPS